MHHQVSAPSSHDLLPVCVSVSKWSLLIRIRAPHHDLPLTNGETSAMTLLPKKAPSEVLGVGIQHKNEGDTVHP